MQLALRWFGVSGGKYIYIHTYTYTSVYPHVHVEAVLSTVMWGCQDDCTLNMTIKGKNYVIFKIFVKILKPILLLVINV